MGNHNYWARKIAASMQKWDSFPVDIGCGVVKFMATHHLRELLLLALSPLELKVLMWITENEMDMVAREVSLNFDISITSASTILKNLHEYGLLARWKVRDNHGQYYAYSVDMSKNDMPAGEQK